MRAIWLPSLIVIAAALMSAPARAQDLDHDKSGAKLFAATCADCHRSARGLAKGRLSFTLSYYLRQHYTSSAATAQMLTAYLQSVDAPTAKTQPGARKSQPPATRAAASTSALRPPATVPGR